MIEITILEFVNKPERSKSIYSKTINTAPSSKLYEVFPESNRNYYSLYPSPPLFHLPCDLE